MTSRNELKKVLQSYGKNWNTWRNSDACFLNPFEIDVIEVALSNLELRQCAAKFGISELGFIQTVIKITYKLKLKMKLFHEWNESLFMEDHYLTKEDMLLNAPIHLLPISQELKQWLFYTKKPNILSIVETFSEMDLMVWYDFPEHILFELKKHLGPEQSAWFGGLKKKSKQKLIQPEKRAIKIHLN